MFYVIKCSRKARNLTDSNFYGNCLRFSDKMTLLIRIKAFNNLKNRHAVCLKFRDIFLFSPTYLLFGVEISISSIIKGNESVKLSALCVKLPTCFACLRARVPMCLPYLCAHVTTCITCLRAHVATCLSCLRAMNSRY